MKKAYPMEALLRPPVEFYTAFSAAGAAAGASAWGLGAANSQIRRPACTSSRMAS